MPRRRLSRRAVARAHGLLRHAWKAGSSDRGSISTEYALLFALVSVLTIFAAPQLVLVMHARELAHAATQTGARTLSTAGAPPGSGASAADSFMQNTAGNAVSNVQTGETVTATDVTVTVTASVPLVIQLPGVNLQIQAASTRARERFTTPGAS